jgi:hypothetical protein
VGAAVDVVVTGGRVVLGSGTKIVVVVGQSPSQGGWTGAVVLVVLGGSEVVGASVVVGASDVVGGGVEVVGSSVVVVARVVEVVGGTVGSVTIGPWVVVVDPQDPSLFPKPLSSPLLLPCPESSPQLPAPPPQPLPFP